MRDRFASCVNIHELLNIFKAAFMLAFCAARLYFMFGFAAVYILTAIGVVVYLNKGIENLLDNDSSIELGKKHEELRRQTKESFDSIRTIKQYGWDDFFLARMAELRKTFTKMQEDKEFAGYITSLVLGLLPRLVAPLTFIVSIYLGNVISFAETVELMALIDRLMWPLQAAVDFQRRLVDVKIALLKVEDYLGQPEVKKADLAPEHDDYAIHIDS